MRESSALIECSREANLLCLVRTHVRGAVASAFPHPVCGNAVRDDRLHDDVRGDVGRRVRPRRDEHRGRLRGHGHRHLDAPRWADRRGGRGPGQSQADDRARPGRGRGDPGPDRRAVGARRPDVAAVLPADAGAGCDVRVHGPGAERVHPRHRRSASDRQRRRTESTRAHLGAAVRAADRGGADRQRSGRRRHLHRDGLAGLDRRRHDGVDAGSAGAGRRTEAQPRVGPGRRARATSSSGPTCG